MTQPSNGCLTASAPIAIMSIWVSEGSGTIFAPIVISRHDQRRRCLHDPDPMVDRVGVIVNNPLTKRRVLQKPFPLCACKVMLFLRRQPPLKLGPHFRRLPRMFGKRIKASFGYLFLARCDLFVNAMCVGRHRWNGAGRIPVLRCKGRGAFDKKLASTDSDSSGPFTNTGIAGGSAKIFSEKGDNVGSVHHQMARPFVQLRLVTRVSLGPRVVDALYCRVRNKYDRHALAVAQRRQRAKKEAPCGVGFDVAFSVTWLLDRFPIVLGADRRLQHRFRTLRCALVACRLLTSSCNRVSRLTILSSSIIAVYPCAICRAQINQKIICSQRCKKQKVCTPTGASLVRYAPPT